VSRTYRRHRIQTVYLSAFCALWFFGVVGIALYNLPDRWTAYAMYSAVYVGLFAILPAVALALSPHEVTVSTDGTCLFRSLIRSRTVRAQQIRSITYDEGDLTIRHDRGKIRMRVTYDFEDLLAELMELNPGIELARTWAKELDNRLQH
jgi:hypothetical protein